MEMSPSNWKEEDTYCGNTHVRTHAHQPQMHRRANANALFSPALFDVPTGSPVPQQDSPDMDGVYV